MSKITKYLNGHSLGVGIFLMFALTWPLDLANAGLLPFQVPFAVYIFIGWGLSIAALIMSGLSQGKSGVIALLKRFLIWRVNWKRYLAALLLYPLIFVSAVLLNAWISQTPIDFGTVMAHRIFGTSTDLLTFIIPFFIFDFITNGEELAWRGYVLPRLQAKHSALVASLILGVIWGFWHLPRYLAPDSTASFGWSMAKIMLDAIIFTWLFNSTRGSLFLVSIMHSAGNTAGVFLPMANTVSGNNMNVLIIAIAIELVVAVAVIMLDGPARLARIEPLKAPA